MRLTKSWLITVLILGVLAALILVGFYVMSSWKGDFKKYHASFDADDRYFSLTYMLKNGQLASLAYDADEDKYYSIQSRETAPNYGVRSQKLSRLHKGKIYVTRYEAQLLKEAHPGSEAKRELYLCDLGGKSCEFVFSSKLNIRYPIELDDGGLLFVGSKPNHNQRNQSEDANLGYLPHDFYYRGPDGDIRKLTDGSFFQLASVNLAHGALFFSGVGGYDPLVKKLNAQKLFRESDIIRLPFDRNSKTITVSNDDVVPYYFSGSELDSRPSVVNNSELIAYLGGISRKSEGRYYHLFIDNLKTKDNIFQYEPYGPQSLYGPTIIGPKRVRLAEFFDGKIHFLEYSTERGYIEPIADIDVDQIISPHSREVQIIYVEDRL